MSRYYQAVSVTISDSMRRSAQASSGSRLAQIKALNPAGGYDCQFSDGIVVSNVQQQDLTKYQVGMWVTLNKVSGVWVIVSSGAAHA